MRSRKARNDKEKELRKHYATVQSLKKKIAKQIVNKTAKIEEFKEQTMDDLFKHAEDMEKERGERR